MSCNSKPENRDEDDYGVGIHIIIIVRDRLKIKLNDVRMLGDAPRHGNQHH